MITLNELLACDDRVISAVAVEAAELIKQLEAGEMSTEEFTELSQSMVELTNVVDDMVDLQRRQQIQTAVQQLLTIMRAAAIV